MADKQVQRTAEHLKDYRWKKGAPSPNPKGRPRHETPSEVLTKMLAAPHPSKKIQELQRTMPEPWRSKKHLTVLEMMTWVEIADALNPKGYLTRKDIFDRVEGRPVLVTDKPIVVQDNSVTNVQNNYDGDTSFESVTSALKALVTHGILPAEAFARFAITQGNGHIPENGNGHDVER